MKFSFNSIDLLNIILENTIIHSEGNEKQVNTNMLHYSHPSIGRGSHFHVSVKEGVDLLFHIISPMQDLKFTEEFDNGMLGFGYIFSGLCYHSINKIILDAKAERGMISISHVPSLSTWKFNISSSLDLIYARVYIHPKIFHEMVKGYYDNLPEEIVRNVIDNSNLYYKNSKINPMMFIIFQQIINCPYSDLSRKLFLESKILELISIHLDAYNNEILLGDNLKISKSEIEKIQHVKSLLLNNFHDSSLSIEKISKEVGLNEFKLKSGFKKVFGSPIFDYLHQHRMDKALEILQTSETTVKEACYQVGYNSIGSFSNAFYKKFKMRPSEVKVKTSPIIYHYDKSNS